MTTATLVLTLIGRSRTPVTYAELCDELRCSRRLIEQAVQDLRLRGEPICTDSRGAWVASSSAEVFDQYRRLRRRYISQAVTARRLRATAAAMQRRELAQMSLWAA